MRISPWLLACVCCLANCATAGAAEALLADGTRVECSLNSVQFGAATGKDKLVLLGKDGSPVEDALDRLVRWGSPSTPGDRASMLLVDGSVLATNRPWSASGFFEADRETVSLRRREGWVKAPRDEVTSIQYEQHSPQRGAEVTQQEKNVDTVHLRNGDILHGEVERIDRNGVDLLAYGEQIEAARERVAAVHFGSRSTIDRPPAAMVGLVDGSLLHATRFVVEAEEAQIELGGKLTFTCPIGEIVFVQPLRQGITYLSDLQVVDYQHTPYFQTSWPLALDSDFEGNLIRCAGVYYAKGVAMHSASRAVYRLDGNAERFQAELGIADTSDEMDHRGSVVFGVYLLRGGEFQRAYQSEVIRGGQSPTPIDIDLAGASAMALVVDYADQADTRDHALWLDARLVSLP